MSKTVVINLGAGSLEKGFKRLTVRLWSESDPRAEQFVGSLAPAPALIACYRLWQSTYRALANRLVFRLPDADNDQPDEDELEIDHAGITQVSQQSFETCRQQLEQEMNRWLAGKGLLSIERQLRSRLHPTNEIRVIFETDDDLSLRLPWHCWTFFQDYPRAEMALSQPAYQRVATLKARENRQQVRILAIVGDRQGIDVSAEQALLQALPDAEVQLLIAPSRQEFDRYLQDSAGWDLLFFAGHSQTEGAGPQQTGRLYINEQPSHNSLTIEQLSEALKRAIAHGLQLAIFNSCDGVGLAQALGRLQIPQIVVMREPVPNRVAQLFLQHFLVAFARERLPLYPAMRQARSRLQGLEDEFPGASWLPILYQNPSTASLTWAQMGGVAACPYRGLEAFRPADADLFFGRDQVVADLLATVKQQPFVAVTGPSGSGKSSVVFAGLIPRLQQETQCKWQIASCRPGIQPFDALAESLAPVAGKRNGTDEKAVRLQILEWSVDFQQDPQALWGAIAQKQSPGTQLLLVIDQFEELYTLCSPDDRQPFIDLLLEAVQAAPAFTLLLTLRADFYGYALSDRRLSDALQLGGYNLGPMSPADLKAAIARPAAQQKVVLEPGLTDQLIQATSTQAGRLPLLEFTLSELWSRQQAGKLTHQAYQAIGGVEKAVANHAEAVYANLSLADQARVQGIFMQLIEPGNGSEATRRVASQDDVGSDNWDLVSQLASARLVVTNRNSVSDQETVEIIHEALIRHWKRLTYWLQIDGEFRRWQEDLRRASEQWATSEQDPDALLRGKRLAVAADWFEQRQDELSAGDQRFIQQSLAAKEKANEREKRRRRAIVSSLTAGLLAALGFSGAIWWGSQQRTLSEVKAIALSSDSLFRSGQTLDALIAALSAQQTLSRVVWPEAETTIKVESMLSQAIANADEQNRFSGHMAGVTGVAFSQSGQIIASAGQDGTVRLWQPNGRLTNRIEAHKAEIWGLAISPDGQTIASASDDRTVKLWSREGTLLETLTGHESEVTAVAFSPDGRLIAAATQSGIVKLWSLDGRLVNSFQAHEQKVDAIAFSSNGQLIATGSGDNTIKTWSPAGDLISTFTGHEGSVRGIAFSPDGETIASASADHTIKLWNLDGAEQTTFSDGSKNAHANIVYGIAFSPDGQLLASASDDRTVKLWRRDGSLLETFRGHRNGVTSVAFSPDGQTVASTSFDSTVRLWRVNSSNPLLNTFREHRATVWDVAFSPKNDVLASASDDGTVKLWQIGESPEDSLLRTLEGDGSTVFSLAFSPDSQWTVSGDRTGNLRLWNQNGSLERTITAHQSWISSLDISPDGTLIASASGDGTIKLWQQDGSLVKTLNSHQGDVDQVAFSPDGQLIASASSDRTIKLWRRDGSLIETLEGHEAAVNGLAFSPDGQTIASVSDDRTLKLWQRNRSSRFEEFASLTGHSGSVIKVAFSPEGRLIASTSTDKTVKLWDSNGMLLATLAGNEEGTLDAAFSPDGQQLAITTVEPSIIVWQVDAVLNVERVLTLSCEWVGDYLRTNAEIEERIRRCEEQ